MVSGFYIKKVIINNFRGYLGEKEFDLFPNGKCHGVIILGGSNGFGKTSLLDAIEWCLTGKNGRLSREYKEREEDSIRKQKGLIRNTASKDCDKVSVEINGIFRDREISIYREFYGGREEEKGLINKSNKITIKYDNKVVLDMVDGDKHSLDKLDFFNFDLSNLFYDRFVCSYEKNIRLYGNGRKDFYRMFSSFLGGTEDFNKIENKLEGYKKGSVRVKGLTELSKDKADVVRAELSKGETDLFELNKLISELEEKSKEDSGLTDLINNYPREFLYDGEVKAKIIDEIKSAEVKSKAIWKQVLDLKNVFELVKYWETYCKSSGYIQHLNNMLDYRYFHETIYEPFIANTESIQRAQRKNKEHLLNLRNEFEQYRNKVRSLLTVESGLNQFNSLKLIGRDLFKDNIDERNRFCYHIELLSNALNQSDILETNLKMYSNNDPVIIALRALVDNIKGFESYRANKEAMECPLCGSVELFAHAIKLAEGARNSLGIADRERELYLKALNEQVEFVKKLYTETTTIIINYIDKKALAINDDLNNIDRWLPLRSACATRNIDFDCLTRETLMELKSNYKCLNEIELDSIELELISGLINEDNNLLGISSKINPGDVATKVEFLSCSLKEKQNAIKEFKSYYETKSKEITLIKKVPQIEELDIEYRIQILNRMKNGYEQNLALNIKMEEKKQLLKKIDILKSDYEKYFLISRKVIDIVAKLRSARKEWEDGLADIVSEPLNLIYRRINRHNNYKRIIFEKPERGTAKNIEFNIESTSGECMFVPNVVSTGQLSTIAISSFMTIAMGQSNLPFRCYFMDDPIQSMDDINVLSFIDLLRVQLSQEDTVIDQLFISTCDEDLEALIVHKMKTFGINVSHLKFGGYGSLKKREGGSVELK